MARTACRYVVSHIAVARMAQLNAPCSLDVDTGKISAAGWLPRDSVIFMVLCVYIIGYFSLLYQFFSALNAA